MFLFYALLFLNSEQKSAIFGSCPEQASLKVKMDSYLVLHSAADLGPAPLSDRSESLKVLCKAVIQSIRTRFRLP